jgi:hypothetical protein
MVQKQHLEGTVWHHKYNYTGKFRQKLIVKETVLQYGEKVFSGMGG